MYPFQTHSARSYFKYHVGRGNSGRKLHGSSGEDSKQQVPESDAEELHKQAQGKLDPDPETPRIDPGQIPEGDAEGFEKKGDVAAKAADKPLNFKPDPGVCY